jgi:hypothetical protein
LLDHEDQFVGAAAALVFGQQRPIGFQIDLLALVPGLGLEAGHVELASRDTELAAKHEFFVGDHSAGLGLDPVVAAVVGDVDDLLAKREIGAYLPRAHEILTKVLMEAPILNPEYRPKKAPPSPAI